MKRIIFFFLAITLVLSFCGCKGKPDSIEQPASFYYLEANAEKNVFAAEIRETKQFSNDLQAIADDYFSGPTGDAYVNVFPADLHTVSVEIQDAKLILTVSDELSLLSGLDLSIACACMGMTLLEITECTQIEILTQTQPLDGKSSILLTLDDLYLLDTTLSAG